MDAPSESTGDCALLHHWHPVAWDRALAPGQSIAARVLDREVVVWRDASGRLSALEDRCPHRGTRLSIGDVHGDRLVCAYHGWQFDASGRCRSVPAHPQFEPPERCAARRYSVDLQEGAIVVAIDPSPRFAVAPIDSPHRRVQCGPYDVEAAAPRLIENFLDIAHLGFVHDGILGLREHGSIADYSVEPNEGGIVASGLRITQPQAHADSQEPAEVDYTYRVLAPLVVQLEKHTGTGADRRTDTIRLRVAPVTETRSRAFIDVAISDPDTPLTSAQDFQDAIFAQDLPILENQVPARLPLDPAAERSMPSDRLSVAYRRYLHEQHVLHGVIAIGSGSA
ncbi:hypothetical protein BH09PSE6_BH09PSE6_30720 [soil metagenome]